MRNVLILFVALLSFSASSQELSVTATVYNAVPEQTNEDPQHTATMFKLDLDNPYKHRIIAVSRDLEKKGFKMNSTVCISGTEKYDGIWYIRDRMNKRYKSRIDFLINLEMPIGKWENVMIYLAE